MKRPRVNARHQLFRHAQLFFEQELRGIFSISDAQVSDQIPADPPEPGKLAAQFGRWKEIVELSFGGYCITVSSPHETPPLGRVSLRHGTNTVIEGPIDHTTWKKIGEHIRNQRAA